jgi:hypothetical protein
MPSLILCTFYWKEMLCTKYDQSYKISESIHMILKTQFQIT